MTLRRLVTDVDSAATRLGISRSTVKRMCADGRLNCRKLGKKTWAVAIDVCECCGHAEVGSVDNKDARRPPF